MSESDRAARAADPFVPEWERFTGAVRGLVMANALLAFALETAMLVFVGWWALELDLDLGPRVLVCLAAVGALATAWGLLVSPRARFRLPVRLVVVVKLAAFAIGAAALWAVGSATAAAAFGALAAVNTVLVTWARAGGSR